MTSDFRRLFVNMQRRNATLISSLAQELGAVSDDAHRLLVRGAEDALICEALHCARDDNAKEAISCARAWVAVNLTDSGIEGAVAMAIYLKGTDGAQTWLMENREPGSDRPPYQGHEGDLAMDVADRPRPA